MVPSLVLPGDWQGQAQMAQISLLSAYLAGRDLVPHPRHRLSKAKNRGAGTEVARVFRYEGQKVLTAVTNLIDWPNLHTAGNTVVGCDSDRNRFFANGDTDFTAADNVYVRDKDKNAAYTIDRVFRNTTDGLRLCLANVDLDAEDVLPVTRGNDSATKIYDMKVALPFRRAVSSVQGFLDLSITKSAMCQRVFRLDFASNSGCSPRSLSFTRDTLVLTSRSKSLICFDTD